MKAIKLSDIVTIGEFKSHAATWLDRVRQSGQPVVITQNGKPAGVILSPSEYERLQYREALSASIDRGISQLDSGQGIETAELERSLKKQLEVQKAGSK
jgi:antitoxin YefM